MSDLGIVIPPFQPTDNSLSQSEPDNNLEGLNEFAQGILSKIPDEDRTVVAKYIKEWDGGVTQHLQKIHADYAPYKELGELENLQESLKYYSMIQNDPASVVMAITEALKENGMSLDDLLGNNDSEVEQQTPAGLPPEVLAKLGKIDQLETMLSNMHEQFQTFATTTTEERQLEQLDNLMTDMHSRHGDFNDEFVLLQLEKGLEPEKAVEAWKSEVEKFSSPRKPAPTLLSSNGAVKQQDQVDPSKLTPADRKAFVASIMAANMGD